MSSVRDGWTAENVVTGEALVMAVEGGGTKTECLVATVSGRIAGYGAGGPVNLNFISADVAEQSIDGAVRAAVGDAPVQLAVLCLGATTSEEFAGPILARRASWDAFLNTGEPPACLASATTDEYGAVVLAGTGCFEWARNPAGLTHRTDGLGTLMGDEGSAYDLVRRALVACGRAWDGRGPATAITEQFCIHFGEESIRGVSRQIYRRQMARHEFAALAPLVAAVADEDEVARGVLAETGRLLAHGLLTCLDAVGLGGQTFDVALCGGVFHAGEHVIAPIRRVVTDVAPDARLVRPEWPPVVGALALALREAGHPLDRERLDRLGHDYLSIAATVGKGALR